MKMCECGCGLPAPLATRNRYTRGHIKGQPLRFISGHQDKARKVRPAVDRFWAKVRKTDTCWIWIGGHTSGGYGSFSIGPGNATILAHRFSYELHFGPIPEGPFVCHDCPGGDNPACVNPAHLWLGTSAENVADCVNKGRARNGADHQRIRRHGEEHYAAKVTEAQVLEIRARYTGKYGELSQLAREYGLGFTACADIVQRRSWKHL